MKEGAIADVSRTLVSIYETYERPKALPGLRNVEGVFHLTSGRALAGAVVLDACFETGGAGRRAGPLGW